MSRELGKYRGQHKDGKGWVYGYLISPNRIMVWDSDVCMRSESYEAIPETVGEFTGLKDSKRTEEYPEGQEIYEGDRVKLGTLSTKEEPEEDEHIAQVMFSKGQFWCTYYGFPVQSWALNDKCFIEVIGNIHDEESCQEKI